MTAQDPFVNADVEEIISKLSIEEKIRLLGAPNWWNTNKIERLGVPSVRMSDGPNGVRGSSHFLSSPAQCIPCATALGATFDTSLVHRVGQFLAIEAKTKSSCILLAPTCNIQRSPLGGRSFESFSEDPHLSGHMAAAYVDGLQSKGVAATIKHFVANDQEHERMGVDTIVSERALREIYLMPFMIAQRDSKPWAYMTAYNRVGGTHVSECKRLLGDVLRKEWGFDGLVMSDWYGTYSVDIALNAGLDLEMPGPPRWRQPTLVNHALTARKILPSTIDTRARTVLEFVQKMARVSPEVVFGDGEERTRDDPKDRSFNRELASQAIVLLKNERGVLPLNKPGKLLIVGPNAQARVISGGGSAFLRPSYVVTPWDGINTAKPKDVNVKFEVGCYAHKFLPTLENLLTSPDGQPGWEARFFTHDEHHNPKDEVARFILNDTRVKLNDFLPEGLTPSWTIKLRGTLRVPKSAPFEFGLTVAGRSKLWVDGKMVIDNWTKQRPGEFFYGQGSAEEKATVDLKADTPIDIYVEYDNLAPAQDGVKSQPALMRGVRLGGAEKIDPDEALSAAATAAAEADAVIAVVGLNHEWESEGFDRPTLAMPGRQNELIEAVAKANRNTIVVIQAGSAVSMPWIDKVAGVLQSWYLGNEAGNAISDVLFGKVNPSGRLPISLPRREEDIPAHLSFGSEMGKVHYREDVFVGYKYYQARKVEPLFPFGFGLSYTSFEVSDLKLQEPRSHDTLIQVKASVTVKNTGSNTGSETVQLYVAPPKGPVTHPNLQLRAFAKAIDLAPGASTTVELSFGKYGVSFWHEEDETWRADAGEYGVFVGTSSEHLPLSSSFTLKRTFSWRGL
ncbi:glycoside hydrolase family 3 protein [Ceratobasidium sp. AG-Ba]|nr:glycoside hydrolase family 3 protein [Ceratobasidium sp. AG-Ba]QRW15251.1 glycoside hydrolase family 3 protein [Ceratobasidium sp. AG-Ba]